MTIAEGPGGAARLLPATILLVLLATGAAVALQMKRTMVLSPAAHSNAPEYYHPIADMDGDGLPEMAYFTGRSDSMSTNPQRWEYGRFLPFNRWRILYADTIIYPPPIGLQPAYFRPMDVGDADRDGLKELLGHCFIFYRDTFSGAYSVLSTMEQRAPTGPPDTITWYHVIDIGNPIYYASYMVGSLDGDSLYDFINYSDSAGNHVILENRGDNSYTGVWAFPPRLPSMGTFAFGDCDMDGRIEFFSGQHFHAFIWETVGDNRYQCTWQDSGSLYVNFGYDCFSGRDVNQNGKPEFFGSTARFLGGMPPAFEVGLHMWEATGDNQYQRTLVATGERYTFGSGGRSMCGDLDGDGVEEVIWSAGAVVEVLTAEPGGIPRPVCSWGLSNGLESDDANVNIADVNRNGYNDAVVSANMAVWVNEVEAIALSSPQGGEDLVPGETCRISWRTYTPPRCDSVSLFLRVDSTYRLDTIARGLAPADTPYVWVVPDIRAESAWVMAIAYGPGWQYDECDSPIRMLGSGAVEEQPQPVLQTSLKVRPNPARGRTSIEYVLGRAGPAEVLVLDAVGREVALLATGEHLPGRYRVAMDRVLSRAAPGPGRAGVYFVRLVTGQERIVQKVVVQ